MSSNFIRTKPSFLEGGLLLTIKNDEQKKEVFLRIC